MTLKEKLLDDMKLAMKSHDTLQKNVITMARAAILQVEKDRKVVLDDEGVLLILSKEVKKRNDAIPEYEKGGRIDIVTQLKQEIELLQVYLPEPMDIEALEQLIGQTMDELQATGMKDMGRVMAELTPKIAGRADGKQVSQIVRQRLQT